MASDNESSNTEIAEPVADDPEESAENHSNLDHQVACDSDDDLPPAFDVAEESNRQCTYKINDIVWAKYRALFWPAVVLRADHKKKRVTVMFVDAPETKNNYTLCNTSVFLYGNNKMSNKLREQFSKDGDALAKLNGAIGTVEDFLCKRILKGNMTPPAEYFRCPAIYAVSGSAAKASKEAFGKKLMDTPKRPLRDDLLESSSSSKDDAVRLPKEDPKLDKALQKQLEQLVQCIKSNPCKKYLMNILQEKVHCTRHKRFFSHLASKRKRLKFISGFGPIEDYEQAEDICIYLTEYLKQQTAVSLQFSVTSYVFDVWAPEAIVWALARVFKLTPRRAESMFRQGKLKL